MAKIAILGFGTVGSGVYEVLCRNAASVSRRAGEPVEVKYILDPKDFTGNPVEPLVVKSIDVILQDPEIRVVVETIGGTRFAYPYVKACLESGRSVCTSNKEMVATYGAELLALAKAHNCAFLFEASVGGGTPIITPMHQCLAANVITAVEGIGNALLGSLLAWAVLGRRTRIMSQHLDSATMPEFFGKRFGRRSLKIAASVIIFIFLIPYTASLYNGLSRLFGMNGVWAAFPVSELLTALLTLFLLLRRTKTE